MHTAMSILFVPFQMLMGFLIFLATSPPGWLLTAFMVWMLIDCVVKEKSEGNDKIIWVTIILLLQPMIGALIYLFIRRPQRRRMQER